MKYQCGCSDMDQVFRYCATHALSDKTVEIRRFWETNWEPKNWEAFKRALVVGLELKPLEDQAHPCTVFGCKNIVPYDDEPKCYEHSPEGGSFVENYSYKEQNERANLSVMRDPDFNYG